MKVIGIVITLKHFNLVELFRFEVRIPNIKVHHPAVKTLFPDIGRKNITIEQLLVKTH